MFHATSARNVRVAVKVTRLVISPLKASRRHPKYSAELLSPCRRMCFGEDGGGNGASFAKVAEIRESERCDGGLIGSQC